MIRNKFLVALGSFFVSFGAVGAPVTFSFDSNLWFVSPALVGLFDVGESIKGSFTFESATPNMSSDSTMGVYQAVTNFSLVSGPDIFSASTPTSTIEVRDGPNAALDQFLVSGTLSSGSAISGFSASSWKLSLIALDAITFDSVALPSTPPPLTAALIADLVIFYDHPNNGGQRIVTTLTSLELAAPVPEPETYALMLAGLGLVGFAARRRKRA